MWALRAAIVPAVAAAAAERTRSVRIAVTGDVNFPEGAAPSAVWGDFLPTLQSMSGVFINHESTVNTLPDKQPNDYKYEDSPIEAFREAGVKWVGQANNHQFDFWGAGVEGTIKHLREAGLVSGGLGAPADVRSPTVVTLPDLRGGAPVTVAVFSLVAQLCHKHQGVDVMTSCTCGVPSAYPTMPPLQCYGANGTADGLWYLPHPVTAADAEAAAGVIRAYTERGEADVVVAYLHAGPNFEWQPSEDREILLRALAGSGVDLVWGTSSHHVQRTESVCGVPVVYGIGDFMFRFVPGVDKPETCEKYMSPCTRFRPDLSAVYAFEFEIDGKGAKLSGATVHASQHNSSSVRRASAEDRMWFLSTFNNLSDSHGVRLTADGSSVLRMHVDPTHKCG